MAMCLKVPQISWGQMGPRAHQIWLLADLRTKGLWQSLKKWLGSRMKVSPLQPKGSETLHERKVLMGFKKSD